MRVDREAAHRAVETPTAELEPLPVAERPTAEPDGEAARSRVEEAAAALREIDADWWTRKTADALRRGLASSSPENEDPRLRDGPALRRAARISRAGTGGDRWGGSKKG